MRRPRPNNEGGGAILHLDWKAFLERLPDEKLGQWTRAVMQYMETGEPPERMDEAVDVAFYAALERIERDLKGWEKKVQNLKQNRPGGDAHRIGTESVPNRYRIGPESACVPVPVPVPVPESSVDDSPPGGGTTTTPALIGAYERTFGAPPTNHVARKLEEYAAGMSVELVCRVLEECRKHDAKGWGYARIALEDCQARGVTLEEYEKAHPSGGKAQPVDRPEPSGKDILARRRPIRLKRED